MLDFFCQVKTYFFKKSKVTHKIKSRPVLPTPSGKHAAFANHAPIHLNSTMIRLLFQGGFIYVQDTHTQARKYLFL